MAGEKDTQTIEEADAGALPQEFIDAVNARVEADRPVVETKTEQEAVVEDKAVEATPAVPDPVEDTPAADAKSGAGDAAPTISPELAELARQYGLSDEEVAEFTPAELKRATRLLDREAARMLQAQRPAAQQAPENPAEVVPVTAVADPPKAETPPEKPALTIDQQITALREKGWDEDILALHRLALENNEKLGKQVAYMDGYLRHRSQAEQQFQQQSQARAVQAHTGVMLQNIDGLKRVDLFGSPDKAPTDEQSNNLSAMREAIESLQVIQHRRGLNPAMTGELVNRAYEITFSKQLQFEAGKEKAKGVIKQSQTVMGQGRKATVPAKAIPVDQGNVAAHPRIQEFFAAIKAESA